MLRIWPRTSRMLALALMFAAVGAVPAAAGAAARDTSLADRVVARQATGADWRADLAVALPAADQVRSVVGAIRGELVGGTVRLPSTLELAGDSTIVARRIVLVGQVLRINANGHALRLFPVQTLGVDPMAGVAPAVTSDVITIDVTGASGLRGLRGTSGFEGFNGPDGLAGTDGDNYSCSGGPGTDASPGDPGGGGGEGTAAESGGAGGDITLDIPDGSTNRYVLNAAGGTGGIGGEGGSGGGGGTGGRGGGGGNGYTYSADFPPCDGGNGGAGGDGGDGGTGGTGGAGGGGGLGGNVTVTHPSQGYDASWISINVSGGGGGGGGSGGFPGFPGLGGPGGSGGMVGYSGGSSGQSGPNGQNGFIRGSSFGTPGGSGGPGTSSVTSRGGPFALSVAPAAASTAPGQSVSVTVNTTTLSGPPQGLVFSASGLPANATASFNPPTVNTGGSATLTVVTSTTTPPGTYPLAVTGTTPAGAISATFALTVIGPPTGCSVTNDIDVPIAPNQPGLSNVNISGCAISGPVTATVEAHVVHSPIGSVSLYLRRPDHLQQPLLMERLRDFTPTETGADLTATYYVRPSIVPTNGTWSLFALPILGGTGYIDRWRITLAAMASPPPVGPHNLVSVNSGKCLEVSQNSQGNGALVWQRACGSALNQQWRVEPVIDGVHHVYRLVAVHSSKCLWLREYSLADGVFTEQQPCGPSTQPIQQWWLLPTGNGNHAVVHGWTLKCLDVIGALQADTAPVGQSTCHLGGNQQWRLAVPPPPPPPPPLAKP